MIPVAAQVSVLLSPPLTCLPMTLPPEARGGSRWSPRYAIRRSAWHSLDHAWEILDRST
jgi:hypothetical protein